jgi:glycosyltransferase involved in cell wall biosynthesis
MARGRARRLNAVALQQEGTSVPVSFGVMSTYPPALCGVAGLTGGLVDALRSASDRVRVVDVVDSVGVQSRPAVSQWVRGTPGDSAATVLNGCDVAIIQHEYGIYGGVHGEDVLEVVRALAVPVVVVFHTVLQTPNARQRSISRELAELSASVVTMSQAARRRLTEHYGVDSRKVRVIPHGALENDEPEVKRVDPGSRQILTWGLLGYGKGIEWAIEAMAMLRNLRPAAQYSVVGQTHPRVLEQHGERYRQSLVDRAARLGISGAVRFDDRFVAADELQRIIRRSDVVLLPYDSNDQVASGVLVEAIAAGKPVVSTDFPHARELLATGAGLLVGHRDPLALAAALREVLTEPRRAAAMASEARRLAPDFMWPVIAGQYHQTAVDAMALHAEPRSAVALT